jgi:hypothetical protein
VVSHIKARTWDIKEQAVEGRRARKGGWRKLHKEELHDLYSSSNIIRKFYLFVICLTTPYQ